MTDHRTIREIIEEWLKNHPKSRSRPQPRGKSIYYEFQMIIILISVFSLFHYPPALGLPHADVLILDMTQTHHQARNLLVNLLDQAHLKTIIYESVSINMIRLIPTGNYHYIIFWGHAGVNDMATTESYSIHHHVLEQLTGSVGRYLVHGDEYFSMEPGLVNEMQGSLHGTIVLLMGCNTLTDSSLARAFVGKGAGRVVGWKGLVGLAVTDTFAVSFFSRIGMEHQSTDQSLAETSSILSAMGMPDILGTYAA